MRVNRSIIIISVLVGILSFITVVVNDLQSIQSSIALSLFAGAIFAVVTSLVNYFNEKQKIVDDIKRSIPSVYISLRLIGHIMGNILPQIMNVLYLDNLNYRQLQSIAELNMRNVRLGTESYGYCGFIKNTKVSDGILKYEKYGNNLYNLKHNLDKLETYVLDHDLVQRQRELKQMNNNIMVTYEEEKQIFDKRNLVNVCSAKIHEYSASLILQLDEIAFVFYKKRNESWEECKKVLDKQVDDILKDNY